MSKHLRFGRLLGLLAIMLTLSFAWVQGQNLSSEKVLTKFKITKAANPALAEDLVGTVDQTTMVVTLDIPYRYNVGQPDDIAGDGMYASFKSSLYSNLLYGTATAVDLALPPTAFRTANELGQGLGVAENAPYVLSTKLKVFGSNQVLTMEAENHSFVYYTIAYRWGTASTAKTIVGTPTANWTKSWGTSCTPSTATGAATVTMVGTAITVNVPFGTNLASVPFTFTIPAFAKASQGTAPGTPIPVTGTPNLANPIVLTFNANLTSPLTLNVYPQSYPTVSPGSPTVYTVTAVVGLPSLLDDMLTFTINGTTLPIDFNTELRTQTFAGTIPYSATTWTGAFTKSPYSRMFDANPNAGAANEICTPFTWPVVGAGPFVYHFWIRAEKTSEVSEYILTLTRNACSTANSLLTIASSFSKDDPCEEEAPSLTGTSAGTIVTSTTAQTGTIKFDVPYGVNSVSITGRTISALAKNASVGLSKMTGDTVRVLSECGTYRVYTVTVTPAAVSDAREMLTFGFKAADNSGFGFDWNSLNYAGTIEPVTKTVTVMVPFVTDLHELVAYFTSSPYSCVFIANTDGYVPQESQVNHNDHSNTLTYVVRSEKGTEDRYSVTVLKYAVSSDVSLGEFVIGSFRNCPELGFDKGYSLDEESGLVTINGANINISVAYGSDVSDLWFDFVLGSELSSVAISNGSISHTAFSDAVSGHANFTSPVTITVTAEDLSTMVYTVTVTPRAESPAKELTSFMFEAANNVGKIGIHDAVGVLDAVTPRLYNVHVPFGSNVSALAATFVLNGNTNNFPGGAVMTHSEDMQVLQVSEVTLNDYTTQVAFTVWAENCTTVEYFVNVIVDANGGNLITGLGLTGFARPNCATCEDDVAVGVSAVIDDVAGTIKLTVPFGTDLSDIDLTGVMSEGATISPALATSYTIGVPQVYVVTAENGISSRTYTLTVSVGAALEGAELLTFGFEAENNDGVLTADTWTTVPISQETFRVDVMVPFGTDITELVASFTHSPMSCVYINGEDYTAGDVQCPGVTPNDFSNGAVTYTVVSQSGVETYYNVYVNFAAAQTAKELTAFMLTDINYCEGLNISPETYNVAGSGTTAIAVSVKYGTDLTDLAFGFTISETATVVASNGTFTVEDGEVMGSADFTAPVTFTVKAQDGTTQVYTVTVTVRAANSNKKLTKYWLKAATNGIATDAPGTINEAEKTVEVWVPWGTSVTHLIANFELNNLASTFPGGAVMTHSEDVQYVQTSGVSWNDFTTPVAYTVIAEDCSTVEYFVTIKVTPNTDTGISEFKFTYTDCGCNLVTRIDAYARRIYITVPSTVSLSSLAPTTITITPAIGNKPAASVSPKVNVAQNFSNGPVKYTVTAPDGVTKADWLVYVTNPKCKDTNILTFALPNIQVDASAIVAGHGKPVVIDTVNHKIDVMIKKTTDLTSVFYERTLPCGATICCVGGNCQDNHYLDFSQGGCHTCVVTAQDQTVTQEWTICVHEIDVTVPEVTTWSVMAYNCTDSVAVQSNEKGRVFIVNESAINMSSTPTSCIPMYDLFDWTGTGAKSVSKLVANRLGAWATVTSPDTAVYVKTNGLYGGAYWAFAVDAAGNVSCISKERLYLDICDVTVATVCELRDQPLVWRYTLSEEVLVSYEETRVAGGNWKFVQDADCGILIEDRVGALTTSYGVGAGLTNLKGMLDNSGITLKFIPVCCYTPTKSSTGNVIAPVELTWDAYVASCYEGMDYESMLVKITTPMIATNDYGQGANWMYDNLDLKTVNAQGDVEWFIQSIFNSTLIGKAIPTGPAYYQGIRTNVEWSDVYGLITPRSQTDITLITAPIITANPNPVTINNVVPGNCSTVTVDIFNEGVGDALITALYLDDAAATDGFDIVAPATVPFTLGTWTSKSVSIKFCPTTAGNKTTNLIVEYGVGKTLIVPVTGTTMLIYPIPFKEQFNGSSAPAAWNASNLAWSNYGYNLTNNSKGYVGWGNAGGIASYVVSPGIDLTTAKNPVLSFWYGTYYNSYFRVDVSTDYTNWTTVKDWGYHTVGNGRARINSVDLTAFVGNVVYIRFYSSWRNYYGIDDVIVQEKVTTPVISATPVNGDFGGVQVGATGTLAFSIKNLGVSVLKIKDISVSGAAFTKTDTNTYPFEITDGPGTWAYAVGATGSVLNYSVNFTPTDIGVFTGKVVITYGLYEDMTVEIPLTGEGLSCTTATEVSVGENFAPAHNTWWKYTADRFQITTITSCDPRNTVTPYVHSFDTFIRVYSDCDGTLIAENDDMEAACPTNRANSSVTVVMNEGESIYIFWDGIFINTCETCDDPFYWHINPNYPIDGDVCETAIALTLPVVNHFGTTVGYSDDYSMSPCSPFSNYMDGNDKVYTITTTEEGYLIGNILGAYGSIHVLDVCPKEELEKFHCKAYTGGPNGGQFRKKIEAGTYFVIISTWAPPQTVDFLLNMSWESGSAVDNADLMNTMSVYPNPTNGRFTVSISNAEATDMTLELVNISGQVVYRNAVKAAYSYNEDIDATTFAKGVYYLKVSSAKGVKVEKVVVQ